MRITLASTSASRAAILKAAGVVFDTVAPEVDEEAVKRDLLTAGEGPRAIAAALADAKAVAVSKRRDGLVIGADQTLELEGALHDKPASVEAARAALKRLAGRRHSLHAAVAVARDGAVIWRTLESPSLTMRELTEAFVEAYLARQDAAVLTSVGCYRLEGEGAQLFEAVDGDYFAILGLPLIPLLGVLRREGALAA